MNSLITPEEVAFLSGVSAPIQTQINQVVTTNTNQDTFLANLELYKSNLKSPIFTGLPIAPTAISSTNTGQIATISYVKNFISDLIGGASSILDTLNEISTYLTAQDNSVTLAMTTLIEKKVATVDYDVKQSAQDTAISSKVSQTLYDAKQSAQDGDITLRVLQTAYDTKQSVTTGDAFNVFVFLEISSLSAYSLIALGRDRRALWASFQYLIMGTIGATFILIGIGLMYQMTGTLNMVDLATRLAPDSTVM